ncbi:MAG TPA: FAD-binding oxidoreductase [Bacteroidales bacterium]|nr:FAD-binding oxidoreductase [Bacteroidales bacterium]
MAVNHTKSIWEAFVAETKGFTTLNEDIHADVAIIGGGITGISTAYNLSREGKKVVVLEAGRVGMGTTGSSTGNLYIPTGQFHTILSKHGEDVLSDVTLSRAAALTFIEDRINEFGIDCGFQRVSWNYFSPGKKGSKEIENEFEAIKNSGLNISDSPPPGFPFGMSSIVSVDLQAQFNPLQYVKKLAAAIDGGNCRIFENTRVTNIREYDPCYVETTGGIVKADKVVQATHTPKGIYLVHAQMEVYREYAIAARLKENIPVPGIYWALDGKDKYSIRTYSTDAGDYLIVLGDSRKVGHKELTEESFIKVEEFVRKHFNVGEISYLWAAQNYSPADYLPYIGTSPMEANVYIATGFSADGLIYGTAASIIISDLIAGKENAWAKTFDPKRFNPKASATKNDKRKH